MDDSLKKLPRELIVLLGRIGDAELARHFGIRVSRIAGAREQLGIRTPRAGKVDALTFVRVWQASGSIREVAMALGMPMVQVYARASSLRRKGVRLKDLDGGQSEFWDLVRAAAEEASDGGGMEFGGPAEAGDDPRPGDSGGTADQHIGRGAGPPPVGDRGVRPPELPAVDGGREGATRDGAGRGGRRRGRPKKEGGAVGPP
jgi:hypothetical protein